MVTIESLLALSALFFVKHLLADGPLQTDYQAANKGVFLHPAGFSHAGVHVAGTAICLLVWMAATSTALPVAMIALLLAVEFVAHYLIDWSKCYVDRKGAWAEATVDADGRAVLMIKNKYYFFSFLTDQTCHSLTYVGLVYWTSLYASAV